MATETSVLSPGITAATSTVISIPAGETYVVGIYSASADPLPSSVVFTLKVDTPGADMGFDTLSNGRRVTAVIGPADVYVDRPAYSGTAYGVYYSAS